MQTMVKTTCAGCGLEIYKTASEYNRNVRKNRLNYCGIPCASRATVGKKLPRGKWIRPDISKYSGNRKDEYSKFRFFLKTARARAKTHEHKKVEINLFYLKDLWEKQNGVCPYTGWKLVIAETTGRKDQPAKLPNRASLDRIDSSKGYIVGNVQYVAMIYQFCKNNWTDSDVLDFAKSVANNSKEGSSHDKV